MIADTVAPAGQPGLLADVAFAERAAGMSTITVHDDDSSLVPRRKGTCTGSLVKNGGATIAPPVTPWLALETDRLRSGRCAPTTTLSAERDLRHSPRLRKPRILEHAHNLALRNAAGGGRPLPFSGDELRTGHPGRRQRADGHQGECDSAGDDEALPEHDWQLFLFILHVRDLDDLSR